MTSIPDHIISHILPQLPVKSLVRFKCVSKNWSSFIAHPDFIKAHLDRTKTQSLIISSLEHQNLHTSIIRFFSIRVINEVSDTEISASFPVPFDSYHVLPSCNGLVCFYGSQGGIHVCNPASRKMVTLSDRSDYADAQSWTCGLGFDKITGKYKVVKFLKPCGVDDDVSDSLRLEVFTMDEDNSWRTVRFQPPFRFPHRQPPVFAGGFFYWISDPVVDSSGFSIISFDVGHEIFGVIKPPESLWRKNWYLFSLVELGGKLCLVDLDFDVAEKKRMDIWIFKGNVDCDGTHDLWLRETIIHPSESIDCTLPVAVVGGEILLHGYVKGLGELNIYDPKLGRFRELEIGKVSWQYFHASSYVGSMVPVSNNH
ncbi:hypothetical protein SLE2022_216170 [Rubroshorea leprosula]